VWSNRRSSGPIAAGVAFNIEPPGANNGHRARDKSVREQESANAMKLDLDSIAKVARAIARMRCAATVWLSILAGILSPSLLAAPAKVEVENVRVGFDASLSAKAPNTFKIGTWTPVWVQLRGGAEQFSGFMEVSVADDDGTPVAYRMAVKVEANKSERFTAYVRPGSREPEISIRLIDSNGNRVGGASQDAAMPQAPQAFMPYENLILTLGRPQGVETMVELPGFKIPARMGNNFGSEEIVTARIDVQGDLIPGRWYGYDAARAIVLDTNDRAAMSALDALRGRPLVDWVERGGHLVVSVGANWQIVRDSVLAPLLPGLPNGQERVTSLEALDAFVSSTKQITPPGTAPVMVTKLQEVKERGGTVLAWTSNLPLVIRGAYGFGRVTMITLDVDQKPFSDWPDRSLFWVKALDLKRPAVDATGGAAMGGRGFGRNGVSDLSSLLRASLEVFPGVKLIPFGWVAFFIFLYILLIGPGDYFFLKKVLKRMELTWITFPTIVLTVSLVAYYAAYVLKGNDLLVNKVDLVDIDQEAGVARGNTWVSLFSPQNRDYNMHVIPTPLDAKDAVPAATSSGDGTARAPAGTEVVMSWFSVPEDQFAAMGSSSRRFSFSGSGYAYQPVGGVEYLENVRIPIWSTKCVTAQWFGPAAPLVDSDLEQKGTDRVEGTVTNRQSIPLEDAMLAYGKEVYLLGDLKPGAAVRVELASHRNLSGHLKDKSNHYQSQQQWNRDEIKFDRSDLMRAVMFHDSEVAPANERVLSNAPLHHIDLSGQLALQRPMLVARIAHTGARLVLDKAPSPPKIDQLTLVRLILPLKKSQGATR
jgi:hypothetical protein